MPPGGPIGGPKGPKKCDLPDDVSCEVLRPLETDVGCCDRGVESDDGQEWSRVGEGVR